MVGSYGATVNATAKRFDLPPVHVEDLRWHLRSSGQILKRFFSCEDFYNKPADLVGKVPSLVNHGRFTFDSERELKAGDTLEISISPA